MLIAEVNQAGSSSQGECAASGCTTTSACGNSRAASTATSGVGEKSSSPAFVAEMDFDLAEPIVEAVRAAMSIGACGYGHKGELGEAFAAFAAKRLRWSPDPARVFAIPDVMTGIAEVIQAITPPGSGIVITPPVYQPFFYRLRLAGRRVVEAPLRRDHHGRYDLDPEALDRALAGDDVSACLFASPHNPTGRVWSRAQLITVADICQRRGAALLIDEIHAPLVLPGAEHVPFLSLDP